jgi:dCMP deaminase
MTRPTRDQVYIEVARLIASRATCPRRQVGCVLVDKRGRILATGYNGVPASAPHCIDPNHHCPGVNYPSGQGLDKCEAIHAEQNAILLLADPWAVDTAYVTTFPCSTCIKLLLGTSCQRLVFLDGYPHAEAAEWWRAAGRTAIKLSEVSSDPALQPPSS